MKEGYKSIEEILIEVGEEEGLSLPEMKDIWEHQKKYTQEQMDTDGVYAIFFPFIGTLSLNTKQVYKELKGRPRILYKSIIDKVDDLVKHVKYTKYVNVHKRVIGVNRLTRYIVKTYHTNIDKSKRLLMHTDCWNIIEKYSNGALKKKSKDE